MTEANIKVEYRVRAVDRYVVTRHYEGLDGRSGGCDAKGEFDNREVAQAVGYALAKEEADRLNRAPGDDYVTFPAPLAD